MTALEGWENFYVIVDSSAGALIGTPNVVHFGVVLLLSAVVTAPRNGIAVVAILWGLVGVSGVVYAVVVARRMRSQTVYQAVFDDRLFHVLLPLFAYAMLAVSAGLAFSRAGPALFVVGAAALLLLFIGIHNAWDTVTYYVFVRKRQQRKRGLEKNL